MGQALTAVATLVDPGWEQESVNTKTPAVTDTSEMAMRQSMRFKDWGKSRDLDLIWTKTDDTLEELCDITILPDESIAVSDPASGHIRRFDQDGGEVTEYVGTKYRPLVPSGIACSRHGTVLALCDNKYVKGLREFDLQPPYKMHKEHTKLFAAGIVVAVAPTSGLWVVAEAGEEPCLNVLRDDGTRVRHFGGTQLKRPAGVAIDAMDRVYVTDSDQHCVCVFTVNGDFLFRFGTHGSGDQEFDSPQGVCIDPANNVYVADEGNDRLSVFSADGRLKFYLRTPKPLRRPRGLALDDYTGRLAVTSKYMKWASIDVFVIKEIS